MATLVIEINLDNEAFEGSNGELARILRQYANLIQTSDNVERTLKDVNGNTVGSAKYKSWEMVSGIAREDIYQVLIDWYGYEGKEDEADEIANNVSDEQLADVANYMSECLSMDDYWESLDDAVKDVLQIKPLEEEEPNE